MDKVAEQTRVGKLHSCRRENWFEARKRTQEKGGKMLSEKMQIKAGMCEESKNKPLEKRKANNS